MSIPHNNGNRLVSDANSLLRNKFTSSRKEGKNEKGGKVEGERTYIVQGTR